MKRIELEVEHRYKNRFVGRHRFASESDLIILGETRDAEIRLLGEQVAGVHAFVEFRGESWFLCDAGSESGTWIERQAVVEHELTGPVIVTIAGHQLRFLPKVISNDLFVESRQRSGGGGELYHQIVIRKVGVVVQSHLLPPTEAYVFHHGTQSHVLSPPTSAEWVRREFGEIMVQQRLVSSQLFRFEAGDRLRSLFDPTLQLPMLVAFIFVFLFSVLLVVAPRAPRLESRVEKPTDNVYTRMIFDAKTIKQKREQSQERRRDIARQAAATGRTEVQPAPTPVATTVTPKKSQSNSQALVSQIRTKGLSQLLGKISKRAAKTATVVATVGLSPDDAKAGRSVAAGSVSDVAAQTGKTTQAGSTFKVNSRQLAAVGVSGLSQAGALAEGGVGTGSVGVIDEETEIEGGLDREVISKYIQSQLGHIRYCYDRQLSANPELYGKVLVSFTIGGEGSVVEQKIGTTTLRNAMVEGCILRRVASWRFPRPTGGTAVFVNYPFLFKSTN